MGTLTLAEVSDSKKSHSFTARRDLRPPRAHGSAKVTQVVTEPVEKLPEHSPQTKALCTRLSRVLYEI